jgi:hypothetical protein
MTRVLAGVGEMKISPISIGKPKSKKLLTML